MNITLRRTGRGSRINRDRRDDAFARNIIALAAKQFNEAKALEQTRGLCCLSRHATAVAPWTCDCPCHEMKRNADILIAAGEIEVCPDCLGTGEVIRHVTDDIVREQICLECNGRGWVQ